MSAAQDARAALVDAAVKRLVIRESGLAIAPEEIGDDELLNGPLLSVTSVGFLGMLVRLEDEIGAVLPDDLFVGRQFHTVRDLKQLVADGVGAAS